MAAELATSLVSADIVECMHLLVMTDVGGEKEELVEGPESVISPTAVHLRLQASVPELPVIVLPAIAAIL